MPIVLGYHGCELRTAQKLLGGLPFLPSAQDHDWLGEGSYFWENDPVRAYQWATEPRRKFMDPTVVGAVIDLGHCLDLTTQRGIQAVKLAHEQLLLMAAKTQTPLPENVDPRQDPGGDRVLRRLDCAVMNYLFEIDRTARESDPQNQPYTTVRALFPEGNRLYPGAGFWEKTHIQICVRNSGQIHGVFRIPEWQRTEFELPELYGNA